MNQSEQRDVPRVLVEVKGGIACISASPGVAVFFVDYDDDPTYEIPEQVRQGLLPENGVIPEDPKRPQKWLDEELRFFVRWEIDMGGDTPEEAARQALAIQRDTDTANTGNYFTVIDRRTGRAVDVDLMCDAN